MMIRKARIEDSKDIAALLMLAMDQIVFDFIGDNSVEKAIRFLESLVCMEANQYSYENCWVAEIGDEIIAMANVYDGSELHRLRAPVTEKIAAMFKKGFNPEDETQSGEIYIDSLGVRTYWQGKGIGSTMLNFLIDQYVNKLNRTIGLLVDMDNGNAKRLYARLGFAKVGEKQLSGKKMEHLQINMAMRLNNV
ncbi:GNAT family N-acetyltransferase [Muricauda sp. MAR_2010_75]|uniref:GNAT family N-acetyltransferase n=1 Tax=Allomuricauda sp. MAR_2010_75 TaxID=1250232 RepID=UPI0005667F17|nr:GNAT family N-acetyltransferase [Muricauda sp. MAR_2010_75]